MARRLAKEKGIFVGTSSSLNVAGALQLARELGAGRTVVTAACDSCLKYLLGGFAGFAGGAAVVQSALRVTLCGAVAMALVALMGSCFGVGS